MKLKIQRFLPEVQSAVNGKEKRPLGRFANCVGGVGVLGCVNGHTWGHRLVGDVMTPAVTHTSVRHLSLVLQ